MIRLPTRGCAYLWGGFQDDIDLAAWLLGGDMNLEVPSASKSKGVDKGCSSLATTLFKANGDDRSSGYIAAVGCRSEWQNTVIISGKSTVCHGGDCSFLRFGVIHIISSYISTPSDLERQLFENGVTRLISCSKTRLIEQQEPMLCRRSR